MTKIEWDKEGTHFFETGVDHGVLYVANENGFANGVPWNGLTAVTEKPSGAEANAQYADNIKYLTITSAEEFSATIEAFTYPKEFEVCDGSAEPTAGVSIGQQSRKKFCLAYRTKVGNDVKGDDYGYKLHIIYNCMAAPSEKKYATVNESPEAITFSWELSTTPVSVTDYKPTASVVIDSAKVGPEKMKQIEEKLFGSDSAEPTVVMPDEIVTLLKSTNVSSPVAPESE